MASAEHGNILIVGAGPTGLSAGLFLQEQGIPFRIIERNVERSSFSKAFGVNPKTLGLFEGTGITEQFLANGRKMQCMNVWKKGFKYEDEWELYDLEMDTPLNRDEGHVTIMNEGGMLLIRIYEKIWRLAGNMTNLLEHLPKGTKPGNVVWESKFQINHRVAAQLNRGAAYLGGDAAHLHSPLGARGMNMGIEDAYTFAQLLGKGALGDYESVRMPVIKNTVRRINAMTQVVTGSPLLPRITRKMMPLISLVAPLILPQARRFILDVE